MINGKLIQLWCPRARNGSWCRPSAGKTYAQLQARGRVDRRSSWSAGCRRLHRQDRGRHCDPDRPGGRRKVKREPGRSPSIVSTGPPIVAVPGVTDQTQDDATATLTQAGVQGRRHSQDYSDTVPAGR